VRIHHLNCGSLCPLGGRLLGGAGSPLSPALMCCHCLLIEGDDRLILVDTGLSVPDGSACCSTLWRGRGLRSPRQR
jgi:hypothetical protein